MSFILKFAFEMWCFRQHELLLILFEAALNENSVCEIVCMFTNSEEKVGRKMFSSYTRASIDSSRNTVKENLLVCTTLNRISQHLIIYSGQVTILDITLETNPTQIGKLMHIHRTNFVTPSPPSSMLQTVAKQLLVYFAMIQS